jgi:DNA-binding transcriptional ArsR family regulator
MAVNVDFATVARHLASPARAAMIGHLFDGRAMTAGELAKVAGVLPSTASEHLAQLVSSGLLTMTTQGRSRYFFLADVQTAEALEALAHICPQQTVKSLTGSTEDAAQRLARICYDHVAGQLGVAIFQALLSLSWLRPGNSGFEVTAEGDCGLSRLAIDAGALRTQRRAFARPCIDWTERRPHLAGALGASIAGALLDQKWIVRRRKTRGLRITPAGSAGLGDLLGLQLPE